MPDFLRPSSGDLYCVDSTGPVLLCSPAAGTNRIESCVLGSGLTYTPGVSGAPGTLASTVSLSGLTTWIDWAASGVAPPSFAPRSVGTKLVLFPGVSGSSVDFALGIENDTLWSSVANGNSLFKWYITNTQVMQLSGLSPILVVGRGGAGSANSTVEIWSQQSGTPKLSLHKSLVVGIDVSVNSSNRLSFGGFSWPADVFQFASDGTFWQRSTSPTTWWWDTDHRTFAIHVNSNLAYFMRGDVNSPGWSTITNRYSESRWPALMSLDNGNWDFGNDVRAGGQLFGRLGASGRGLGAMFLSTGGPSGGADGDFWMQY